MEEQCSVDLFVASGGRFGAGAGRGPEPAVLVQSLRQTLDARICRPRRRLRTHQDVLNTRFSRCAAESTIKATS